MSIQKLTLHNFRSHHHLSISLDPRVTVITGKNGSGKSNILRAIRWLATNRPIGNSMRRRQGSRETKVTLKVDRSRISRTKSDNRNDYSVNGEKVSAPKHSVPVPVAQLLSMSESNFSMHWRGPAFWFGLTAGEVAKELNRIVNLELIDKSLGRIASKVRNIQAEKKVSKQRLKIAQERLHEMRGIPILIRDFKDVKLLYDSTEKLKDDVTRLRQIVSDRERLQKELEIASARQQGLGNLVKMAAETRKLAARIDRITELLYKIDTVKAEIELSERKAEQLNSNLTVQVADRCPLCKQSWEGENRG